MRKEFEIAKLSNGIRIVHERISKAQIAHAGFIINAGSRDEKLAEHGMAHFIEHCVFKGTKKRSAPQIISESEGLGGELNAYTTKEDTSIYASFVKKNWKSQLDLLVDVLFGSVFPKQEIEKEKKVIYDEMNYYLDTPAELIFEEFDALLYPRQSIGRPILGTVKSVGGFDDKAIKRFMKRMYQNPQNIVFAFSGNVSLQKVVNYLEHEFKPYFFESKINARNLPIPNKVFHKKYKRDANQSHLLLGKNVQGFKHKYNWERAILNHYFGGNSLNSRLNVVLREKNGLTYQAESSYQAFSDSGIFSIYVSAEAANLSKVKRLIKKECLEMQKGISKAVFENLKQQFCTQFLLARENRLNNLLAMGKALLTMDKVHTDAQIIEKINSVKLKSINKVAKELFVYRDFSSLSYISKKMNN